MKLEDTKKLESAREMIYPQAPEHRPSSKGKIATTSTQDQRADSQKDYRASDWLQTQKEEKSEATQAMSHVRYPLTIPQHSSQIRTWETGLVRAWLHRLLAE